MRQQPERTAAAGSPAEDASDQHVILGQLAGAHGIKGWVKVVSDTQPRENILGYRRWYLGREGDWQVVDVLDGRRQGKTIIAAIGGVEDRDQALALAGRQISVTRSMLPSLDAAEVYWVDLVGCAVVQQDGSPLGRVARLFETGANDVLVVSDGRQGAGARQEILIPWVRPDVVIDVDLEQRQVVVDWDPDY